MEIIFLGVFIPFPDTALECRGPVIGWVSSAVGIVLGGAPDVPIAVGVGFRGAGLFEPLFVISLPILKRETGRKEGRERVEVPHADHSYD